MATIGRLNYQITANTSGFSKGVLATRKELRSAKRVMEETKTPTERLGDKFDHLNNLLRKGAITKEVYNRKARQLRMEKLASIPVVGRFASAISGVHPGLIAAGAAMAGLTAAMVLARRGFQATKQAVKEQLTEIDKIAKSARTIGATTEELVGLRMAAAEFSGVAADTFDKAIKKMNVQLGDAARGTGTAKDALDDLGLTVEDLQNQSAGETFKDLADAIAAVEDPTKRAYLAQQLFGRSGVELVNTLSAGRAGIEKVQQAAEQLGITFSTIDGAKVEAANDAMGRAGAALQGVAMDLTIAIAPAIEEVANQIVRLTDETSDAGMAVDELMTGFRMVGSMAPEYIAQVNRDLELMEDTLDFIAPTLMALGGMGTYLKGISPAAAEALGSFKEMHAAAKRQMELDREFRESLRKTGLDQFEDSEEERENRRIQATEDLADAVGNLAEEQNALNDAEREHLAIMERGRQITASLRTEEEKRTDETHELMGLLIAGAINQETFQRGLQRLQEESQPPPEPELPPEPEYQMRGAQSAVRGGQTAGEMIALHNAQAPGIQDPIKALNVSVDKELVVLTRIEKFMESIDRKTPEEPLEVSEVTL